MLSINFNKNINKKVDFGTVRFEFGIVQYELYESSRESRTFYAIVHIQNLFLRKNVKL